MKKIILTLVVSMRLLGFEYVSENHIRKDSFLNSQQCTINMSLVLKKEESVYQGEWDLIKSNEIEIMSKRNEQGHFYSKIIGARGGEITYSHSFLTTEGGMLETAQVVVIDGNDKYVPDFLSIPEQCRVKYIKFSKGESFVLKNGFMIIKERGTTILPRLNRETGKIINTVRRGTVYIVPIKSPVLWKRCVFAMSFSDS